MECQVDMLMNDAISLIGKSENLCGLSSNEVRELPSKPSHQAAFEGLVTNFILDQEEKVHQLEQYMSVIGSDFMQLSLEVVEKLKEEIRIKDNNSKRIQKITSWVIFRGSSWGNSTRIGLQNALTIKAEHMLMEFWPTIGDIVFVVGGTSVKNVRDPKVRLAHHCIVMTISGRKESTQRITALDLSYIYIIYGKGAIFNIPYWLVHYLKGIRDKDLICSGMFVTRLARYFRILTRELLDVFSIEPRAYTFKKRSLITIEIVMELAGGRYYWPVTCLLGEDDEVEEATEEETGGSSNVYWDMSRGDWQARQGLWMDQMDRC
ncbi:hypothetical protein Tco_1161611 [Tanacetum coccineum]